jgi:hypothetical protein
MSRNVVLMLTYRPGVEPCESHIRDFTVAWASFAKGKGLGPMVRCQLVVGRTGRAWWEVFVSVPGGVSIPHADKSGWWPYGATATHWVRWGRQVADSSVVCPDGLSSATVDRHCDPSSKPGRLEDLTLGASRNG